LKQNTRISIVEAQRAGGLSVVELVIAMAIILIVSAVAIPSLTKTVRSYQLHDAANQVAGIVKFTRYEAIRLNSPVRCQNRQAAANGPANIWADNIADAVEQPTEKQIFLGSTATLQPVGAVPNTAALATAVGAGALTVVNPISGNITFDQRGAVIPPAIYVLYVGNTTPPDNGFRAVIVLPSGSVQVWTYAGGATNVWQQIS
jgi:Tfp pilus assembly protein FimT